MFEHWDGVAAEPGGVDYVGMDAGACGQRRKDVKPIACCFVCTGVDTYRPHVQASKGIWPLCQGGWQPRIDSALRASTGKPASGAGGRHGEGVRLPHTVGDRADAHCIHQRFCWWWPGCHDDIARAAETHATAGRVDALVAIAGHAGHRRHNSERRKRMCWYRHRLSRSWPVRSSGTTANPTTRWPIRCTPILPVSRHGRVRPQLGLA